MNPRAELIRDIFTPKSTTGIFRLYGEDGNLILNCFMLEDVARAVGVKIKGQTAIGAGMYKLAVTPSGRFSSLVGGLPMPLIYNQPDFTVKDPEGVVFEGIRIHWGNDADSSSGCLIAGTNRLPDFVNCQPLKSIDYFKDTFLPAITEAVKKAGFIDFQIINKQTR